jgi:hypothetical protein
MVRVAFSHPGDVANGTGLQFCLLTDFDHGHSLEWLAHQKRSPHVSWLYDLYSRHGGQDYLINYRSLRFPFEGKNSDLTSQGGTKGGAQKEPEARYPQRHLRMNYFPERTGQEIE